MCENQNTIPLKNIPVHSTLASQLNGIELNLELIT